MEAVDDVAAVEARSLPVTMEACDYKRNVFVKDVPLANAASICPISSRISVRQTATACVSVRVASVTPDAAASVVRATRK